MSYIETDNDEKLRCCVWLLQTAHACADKNTPCLRVAGPEIVENLLDLCTWHSVDPSLARADMQ
jgi:hypothetical protein